MKLIIGCPIYKREWIFPLWASAIERQSIPLNKIGFVFEVSPDDDKTVNMLMLWRKYHKEIPHFEINKREDIPHFEHAQNSRQWTISKYENMVNLRNSLLNRVRELDPDYYFSLDSDIIIKNDSTLELLIGHINDGIDAVNPLMYMTPFGTDFPSVMTWLDKEEFKATRTGNYPIGTFFESDIIMAAKMMSKKVYQNVNYEIHSQGEDLGWSANATKKGYSLGCASYLYAPHIMHEQMLDVFRREGDPREALIFENSVKT
jgi:hypothetical protein